MTLASTFHRLSMVIAERPFEDGRIVMHSRGTGNYVNYERDDDEGFEWASIGQSTGTSLSLHTMSTESGKKIALIGTEDGLDWLMEGTSLMTYVLPDVYPLSYRHQKFGGSPDATMVTHSLAVCRSGDPRIYLLPANILERVAMEEMEWDPNVIYDYLIPVCAESTLTTDIVRDDVPHKVVDRFATVPAAAPAPEGMRHVREVTPPFDERYPDGEVWEAIEFLNAGPIECEHAGSIVISRKLVRTPGGKRIGFIYHIEGDDSDELSVYLHGAPEPFDFDIRPVFLDSRARMALLLRSGRVFVPFIPHSADYGTVRRVTMDGGIGGAENIRYIPAEWAKEAYGASEYLNHIWEGSEMVEVGDVLGEVIASSIPEQPERELGRLDCILSESYGGFIDLSLMFVGTGLKALEHHLVNPLVSPEDALLFAPATGEAKRDFYEAVTDPYDSKRIVGTGIDMEENQSEEWVSLSQREDKDGYVGLPTLYFYLGEDDPICLPEHAQDIHADYVGPSAAHVYPGEGHELGAAFQVDVVANLLPMPFDTM